MENALDKFGWLLLVVAFAAAGCDRSEPPPQPNPDTVRDKVGTTSLRLDDLRCEYERLQAEVAEALRAAEDDGVDCPRCVESESVPRPPRSFGRRNEIIAQ